MRLINGFDVIEHAQVNGESREFIRKLSDYIEDADEVEPKQGEWIPCSERLPDATGFYLCTVNRDIPNVKTMKFELLAGDEYRWLLMNGTEAFPRYVIAWMPLPEPWKGA